MTMLSPAAAAAQTMPPPPVAMTGPAVLAPIPAYARDAPIFPIGPIGSWELDRDSVATCAASRNYGSAERPETVTLLSGSVGSKLGFYVVSSAAGAESRSGAGAVILNPGTTTVGDYSSFDVPARGQHFTVMYVDHSALDGLAAARTLTIRGDRTTTIAAADLKAAMEMTDQCLVKLFQSWGIDTAQFGRGKPAPTPLGGGPGNWFDADADYPAAALRAGLQGRAPERGSRPGRGRWGCRRWL